MDLTGVSVEDAAPLMLGIEEALKQPGVERVVFRDNVNDEFVANLSRRQAEALLAQLEHHFFATKH